MAAVLVAVLLAGCGGEEAVRSPLTVEDLGPGDWAGPFADANELEGAGRHINCSLLGGIYYTGGHELLDEQLAYFDEGETWVKVRAQQYPPDDPDLAGRLASVDRLDRCVVEEGDDRKPDVASATWWREPDGTVSGGERRAAATSRPTRPAETTNPSGGPPRGPTGGVRHFRASSFVKTPVR